MDQRLAPPPETGPDATAKNDLELNRHKHVVGVAHLLFAAVAWGTSFSIGKAALAQVDAFHLTAIRYALAALALLTLLARIEGLGALRMDGRATRVLALGVIGIGGGVLLTFIGLSRTRPEHAAVVVACQPLLAAMTSWFLYGHRPMRSTLIAIAIALTGVTLVVTQGHLDRLAGGDTVTGDLIVLVSALCWVVYTLGARDFKEWSALRYTALTASAGAASVIVITSLGAGAGMIVFPTLGQITSVGWELFYITFISAVLGNLCWNSGIKRIGADGVLFINFVPVTAFVVAIALGHRLMWAEVLGALLVVSALVINHLLWRSVSRKDTRPPSTPIAP